MRDCLEFIFFSFWTWAGTLILIYATGHAAAMPFYWWFKVRQIKMSKSIWSQDLN